MASGLETAYACMGNGVVVDGACKCAPGWKGATCAVLDLLPVRAEQPGWAQSAGAAANWGASAVRDEHGTWHWLAGAKTNTSAGASDRFSRNSGMVLLRSGGGVGGPFTAQRELIDLKRRLDAH